MDFFSNAYNNDLFKALGITTSMLNFFVLTPFLYAIIWYEQFGSDHPRSLINQLVASSCWNGIVHNLLYIPLLIFIDSFGPMSHSFCQFNFLVKNSIIIHIVLMVMFIIFAKYLSIFVLKNPTEVCSDFWCFYLNILSLVLALVSQTAFILFPGNNPMDFNICTGTNPIKFNKDRRKFNFLLHVAAGVCIALFIMVCLRVKIFTRNSVNLLGKPNAEHGWKLPPITEFLEKKINGQPWHHRDDDIESFANLARKFSHAVNTAWSSLFPSLSNFNTFTSPWTQICFQPGFALGIVVKICHQTVSFQRNNGTKI